jgi:hypothetical protein
MEGTDAHITGFKQRKSQLFPSLPAVGKPVLQGKQTLKDTPTSSFS